MLSTSASQLLLFACNQGDVEQCQALVLEGKANLQFRNSLGECCLHVAAARNRVSVSELLLALGADPNVTMTAQCGGQTPLHIAAKRGCLRLAQVLLEHHADANITDAAGRTALHYAVQSGEAGLVELLVRHGASITCPDRMGKTPRDVAVDSCFSQVIPLLTRQVAEGESIQVPSFRQQLEAEDRRIVWKKTKATV